MELYQAMSTLRAVRRLRPDPIPAEVLTRVYEAATWAPSGGNRQPWRIVSVSDPGNKRQLQSLYAPRWAAYATHARQQLKDQPGAESERVERSLAAGDYLAQHLHEAPVIAVVCFQPDAMAITDAELPRPSVVGGGSVYPAVQNLLLAARNEGLGCVITTLLCPDEAEIKALLGMPENWFTCAHVPLGYPVGSGHGPVRRQNVDQLFYRDRWGEPW
jgi:nitroreductase